MLRPLPWSSVTPPRRNRGTWRKRGRIAAHAGIDLPLVLLRLPRAGIETGPEHLLGRTLTEERAVAVPAPHVYTGGMRPASVVVVGGHGFFGRLVVDDLLASTSAHVVVAGRAPLLHTGWEPARVTLMTLDQHARDSVRRALESSAAVVHAAGPYQNLAPSVLQAALEVGVPYVDLADDRSFVQRAERIVAETPGSKPAVVLGMSFVPGLCAVLVDAVRDELGSIESIRSIATPGSRGSRGTATLDSLLSHAGRSFELPGARVPRSVSGWSCPEPVVFPPPIGRRTTYLAIPVADFDLFPRWFGCREVEFRACSDQPKLDRALWMAANLQRLTRLHLLQNTGRMMANLVRLVGRFGTDAGAGLVEIRSRTRTIRVAVVASRRAERLPSLPSAMTVGEILRGRLENKAGLVAAHQAIEAGVFLAGLASRGIETWIDRGSGWNRMPVGKA